MQFFHKNIGVNKKIFNKITIGKLKFVKFDRRKKGSI